MKQLFLNYYRQRGIRYSTSLVNLPMFVLSEFPRDAAVHLYDETGSHPDVDVSKPFFAGYNKRIAVKQLMHYSGTPEGSVRRPIVNERDLTRAFRQKNKIAFQELFPQDPIPTNLDTLLVFNYGYLDTVYKYQTTQMTHYYRWLNRYRTIFDKIGEIAESHTRQHFVFIHFPKFLYGFSVLQQYMKDTESLRMARLFGQEGDAGYMLLDLWRFLSVSAEEGEEETYRKNSVIGRLDPKHYGKVNLVLLGSSGKCALLNLGYLNSWIKGQPNETGMSSITQYPPVFVQKLLLKAAMTLNSFSVEEVVEVKEEPEVLADSPTPETSQELSSKDLDKGKETNEGLDVDTGSIIEDDAEDTESLSANLSRKEKTVVPKNAVEPLSKIEQIKHTSFSKDLEIEIEADIRALDAISLTKLREDVAENVKEKVQVQLTSEEVRERAFKPRSPAESLKIKISQRQDAGLISAADLRRFNEDIEKYAQTDDPYGSGQKRAIAMQIKPEHIEISDDETKIVTSSAVPDKTMASSTLQVFDKKYLKEVHRKDILKAVDSIQKTGVVIRNHEIEVVHSALGSYEKHVLEIKPIDGVSSSVKFTLPIVDEDGTFMAGGNKYKMRKQRVD